MNKSSRKNILDLLKRFLAVFLVGAALLGGLGAAYYKMESASRKGDIEVTEASALSILRHTIGQDFYMAKSDLVFLSHHDHLRSFPDTGLIEDREAVARDFLSLSAAKTLYDQIRFLDEQGMEVVRVNFNNGQPAVVPEESLQPKGKRYYFTDTFRLGKGEIYVSPLDLNIEKGQVERPLKPMIRFGTPVFDSRGRKRGIVLLNYLASHMIGHFRKVTQGALGQAMLLNSDGFWLRGPNPEDEWGFMFEGKKNRRFPNAFPHAWSRITEAESGQFYSADGLFTFATVYPLLEGGKSSTGSGQAFEPSAQRLESKDFHWKIVSYVPSAVLSGATRDILDRVILLYLALLALLAVGSWFAARLLESRRQAFRDVARAKEAAEAASEAKSRFLASMSHEIRTPMNAVIGLTDLALTTQLTPEQRDYLESVAASAKDLLALLNDILDFSKIEAGQLDLEETDFDLAGLLESVVSPLAVSATEKGLALTYEVAPGTPRRLRGDSHRLRQILLNLAGNAVKFTHRGRAQISVERSAQDDEGVGLRFVVADTGIGIPAGRLDKIFESFTQADGSITRRYGGTGLGTTISKQLVEMMGGKIWAESEVGQGSTFYFTVRLKAGQPAQPPSRGLAGDEKEPPPPTQGLDRTQEPIKVLLAEDNPVNQKLIVSILEKRGHEVVVARNGREAVEALEASEFDLVLMDVEMPEMDGLEATRLIRQRQSPAGRHLPIVGLSAHAMRGDRERCLDAGMDEYMTKPINLDLFIKTVERLGRH